MIIDSPSVYEDIPRRGMEAAAEAGVPYYFVECVCPFEVADARVDGRVRRPSQVDGAAGAAAVRASSDRRSHRPATGSLAVETTQRLEACVAEVVKYLGTAGASGPAVPSPVL